MSVEPAACSGPVGGLGHGGAADGQDGVLGCVQGALAPFAGFAALARPSALQVRAGPVGLNLVPQEFSATDTATPWCTDDRGCVLAKDDPRPAGKVPRC